MSGWVDFDPFQYFSIPERAAVYAIYLGPTVVYVGQTRDLRARFREHCFRQGFANSTQWTPWGPLSTVRDGEITAKARFSQRYGDWAMWELRLIKRLQPRFNSQFVRQRAARVA